VSLFLNLYASRLKTLTRLSVCMRKILLMTQVPEIILRLSSTLDEVNTTALFFQSLQVMFIRIADDFVLLRQ
jgi:hypothetical protein